MRKPKLRELKEAIVSLFTPPFTTKFPYQPHIPPKRFRGRPEFNDDECVGCGACANVCPSKAIEVIDDTKEEKRILIHHPDKCIFCGECERNCITEKGIKLTNKFDTSYFEKPESVENKVEHKLVICKNCGTVIGTEKHIRWIYQKLGNLAFSNPILVSKMLKNLDIKTEVEEKITPPIQRTDIMKVICPACRRIAFVSDEINEKK